jgi:molybdopterin synthase sulfurtransferase
MSTSVSVDELRANLLALGISADETVILYGRDTIGDARETAPGKRVGQLAATRAALILHYAGVRDVRVLDGGYDQWVLAGNRVETAIRHPQPISTFGGEIPQRPEFIVDIAEAKSILAAEDAVLVSVRSRREQTGEASGYDYIDRTGRIAGDVWGGGGSDAYQMQHYRNVDNTMRAYPEIAARWQEAGVTPDKRVAFLARHPGHRAVAISRASQEPDLFAPTGVSPPRRRWARRVGNRPGRRGGGASWRGR